MVWALALYLIVQLGICIAANKLINTEADYLVASRNLGLWAASFSMFATWFGAEVVIGSSGAIALNGLSAGRADPFGYTLCLLLMGLLLAGPFRAKGYLTVGDFFTEHYGSVNEKMASVILILTSLVWTAAQIQAFGWILTAVTPLELSQALPIGFVLVVAYTWLGGLLGDVITDVIQGAILLIGLLTLAIILFSHYGDIQTALSQIPQGHWSVIAPEQSFFGQANVWLIPILGSLVAPEALSRTLAVTDATTAKRACYIGGGFYLLAGTIVISIAFLGAPLISGLSNGDEFLPQLIQQQLPPWGSILLLGALTSAILSTIDSTLLSIAGLASRNICQPILHQTLSDTQQVTLARTIVVISGALSYWIATGQRGIYALVELASSFGSAGFLVCVLGGLYWPLKDKAPLIGGLVLILGITQSMIYELWLNLDSAFILNVLGCVSAYTTAQFILSSSLQSPRKTT